jgi:hypothetical protein
MDALKSIPQFFFDVIGRVVPGSVAVILLLYLVDPTWNTWTQFIRGLLAGYGGEIPSTFIALTLFLAAFVAGHIISPAAKLIQRIGERFPTTLKRIDSESEHYAWLRLHRADAGGHCAKLRAEFTMYNSLSAVFFLTTVAFLFLEPMSIAWPSASLIVCLLMAYRGREGRKTFSDAVADFYAAAQLPMSAQQAVQPDRA